MSNIEQKSLIKRLEDAQDGFYALTDILSNLDPSKFNPAFLVTQIRNLEATTDSYFLAASYATTKLDSLGKERLSELKEEDDHPEPLISWDSLQTAKSCVEDYLRGKTEFNSDQYRDLGRVCESTVRLIKEEII